MGIGTLNEGPLHAALKQHYLCLGGREEVPIGGFVADVVCEDKIFEIQTGSFSGLNRKLETLCQTNEVRLVHPVAQIKTIVKLGSDAKTIISKRRSPKRGHIWDILSELVYIPTMLGQRNFSVDVLLIEENEYRVHDPKKVRRKGGWRVIERELVSINDSLTIRSAKDLYEFFEEPLGEPFTSKEIELSMKCQPKIARQMAYVLRQLDLIEVIGKAGRFLNYRFKRR